MSKIWLVAQTTYRRRIRSGTFLVLTFGLPLLMVIAGAIPFLRSTRDGLPTIGYVDQTGRLATVDQVALEGRTLRLSAYPDVGAARAAVHEKSP